MTKTLLKKQLAEVFSWLFQDKKSGKIRTRNGAIGFGLLYLFLFGMLGVIFYTRAVTLCGPVCEVGLGWLYFAIMGLISVVLGVFGSVFSTYSSLYKAKDNDLLLSLPVSPSKVLIARLFGIYTVGLMYELIVMIPTVIVWFIYGKFTVAGGIFSLLVPFILSFFVLTLSCILGFAVALVGSRLKRKNIITVILSLIFLGAYYYLSSQTYVLLQTILANPQKVGDGVKNAIYPFYCMGRGTEGDFISMLIFTAIIAALFAIVYFILAKSFISLTTVNKGNVKVKYKEKNIKSSSVGQALLKKELRRFVGSPTYMLNCGLGIVFMIIGVVALIIKGSVVKGMIDDFFDGNTQYIPLMIAAAIALVSSTCDISAPSVSLEGKNIWIAQVLPISGFAPLKAKATAHLWLTLPPVIIFTVTVEAVLRISVADSITILATVVLFVLFSALAGLYFNLKLPNLTWTNEIIPIKQGMSVMLSLFGGWVLVAALAVIYFVVRKFISPTVYLAMVIILLAVVSAVIYRWLKTKGTKIFETL